MYILAQGTTLVITNNNTGTAKEKSRWLGLRANNQAQRGQEHGQTGPTPGATQPLEQLLFPICYPAQREPSCEFDNGFYYFYPCRD